MKQRNFRQRQIIEFMKRSGGHVRLRDIEAELQTYPQHVASSLKVMLAQGKVVKLARGIYGLPMTEAQGGTHDA